ncbi:MAG: hypothetical protein F6K17_14175 [Okeania sp. SIO3C4]|nr:hypothetical protein [Okeania sp. SIO3C4]
MILFLIFGDVYVYIDISPTPLLPYSPTPLLPYSPTPHPQIYEEIPNIATPPRQTSHKSHHTLLTRSLEVNYEPVKNINC